MSLPGNVLVAWEQSTVGLGGVRNELLGWKSHTEPPFLTHSSWARHCGSVSQIASLGFCEVDPVLITLVLHLRKLRHRGAQLPPRARNQLRGKPGSGIENVLLLVG